MTNTPDKSELLPCRECGAPCSPELFPVHCGEPCDTTIWMCSQHRFLGGKCPSETAYLTKTAWNARASSRPADQVPDMVERVARALSIPQYHTGWDDLPETDKDLFYMQADYAIAALQAVPTSGEVGWQPIESAPKDTRVLVWWPIVGVDDDYNLTDKVVGGRVLVSELTGNGYWDEPDELESLNANYFGDEEEFAQVPTHWHPLPAPPALKASKGTGE